MSNIIQYANLQDASVKNFLLKRMYLTAVQQKDDLVRDCEVGSKELTTYEHYETYTQASNPPGKNAPKHTYTGMKKKVDEDTQFEYEEEAELPMKKCFNLGNESKIGLAYLLTRYVDEIHQFYEFNNYKLPTDDKIIDELKAYTDSHVTAAVSPHILAINPLVGIVDQSHGIHTAEISKKIEAFFKDTNDSITAGVVKSLKNLTEAFLKYVDLIGMFAMHGSFDGKHSSLTIHQFKGLIRSLNLICRLKNQPFIEQQALTEMADYVEATKPKTEKKTKKTDAEDGVDDGDEEVEKKPKKAPAKKTTAKKAPAKKATSKTTSKKTPAEDEGDFEVDYANEGSTYSIDD
jgi:hypothetical protein